MPRPGGHRPAPGLLILVPPDASGGLRRVAEVLGDGLRARGEVVAGPNAAVPGTRPTLLGDVRSGFRAGRRAHGAVVNLHVGGPARMLRYLVGLRLGGARCVVVTLHGAGVAVRWPMHRRLLVRLASAIAFPAAPAARDHRAAGLRHPRVCVIPNGLPPPPAPPERVASRASFGIEPGAFVAGFAGRLVDEKGVLDLARAAASVDGVVLLVAGDGPARARMGALAGPAGRFPGWLDREAMERFYAAADVVVLLSAAETMPLVLVEAALRGLPVIASDIPGVRAVVEAGLTGDLVPAGDVGELAAALAALRDDPARRHTLGRAAGEHARATFTVDAMLDRYAALFAAVARPGTRTS